MIYDMTKWGAKEIQDILYASGYYDDLISAVYKNTNNRNQAVFEITFDNEGIVDTGYVYVGIKNGRLVAEY